MGPKAQSRAPRTEVPENSLEEGAEGGVPRIIHPKEGDQGLADLDSITGMLHYWYLFHFQCDLSER